MRKAQTIEELNLPENYGAFVRMFLGRVRNVPDISRVLLFGSCASGGVGDNSDIDLFVTTKEEPSLETEFFIMDDCTRCPDETYIPADVIVKSEDNYSRYKSVTFMVQRAVERGGVDISECV